MDPVDVVLRKYDGRLHRWVTALRLGEDEHGVWLGTPAGTRVHYNYGSRGIGTTRLDAVRLIPAGRWWIAMFTAEPGEREIYCDICLPSTWTGPAEVTVVDLDLDLARFRPDHRVVLEDADEFAENARIYGYPRDVINQATTAAAELHAALTAGTEPFGDAARPWLEKIAAR